MLRLKNSNFKKSYNQPLFREGFNQLIENLSDGLATVTDPFLLEFVSSTVLELSIKVHVM